MEAGADVEFEGMPHLDGVTHRCVDLPGLRMHVAEAGAGDPVVLLHGFPQHWWEWRHVIGPLAEHYRVIAPDLRGAGWTDAPRDGYDRDGLVADVLGLLDSLELSRVRVVAHDFGALIAFQLAFRHAERVEQLVCLGPHPYLRFDPHLLVGMPSLWFQPVVATPGLGPWFLRRQALPAHLFRNFSAAPDAFSDTEIETFTARVREPARARAGSALYRGFILPEVARFARGAYRRHHLTVPTRAYFGAEEPGVRPGVMDVPDGVADDLEGDLVPGAHHFIADERPDFVVERALSFFARAA